jgi:hypothetical protein
MYRNLPGCYLANDSLWIAIATMLTRFSISKVIGDNGKEITPEAAFTLGVTRSVSSIIVAGCDLTGRICNNLRIFPCCVELRN